mgnify:CR=1 FL=1
MALRTKDEIRSKFARILEEAKAYDRIKMILIKTKREDIFLKATELLLDRAFGKPTQDHNIEGNLEIKINMVEYAKVDNNPV